MYTHKNQKMETSYKNRKSTAHNCHASMYQVYRSNGIQDGPATKEAATSKVEETTRAA